MMLMLHKIWPLLVIALLFSLNQFAAAEWTVGKTKGYGEYSGIAHYAASPIAEDLDGEKRVMLMTICDKSESFTALSANFRFGEEHDLVVVTLTDEKHKQFYTTAEVLQDRNKINFLNHSFINSVLLKQDERIIITVKDYKNSNVSVWLPLGNFRQSLGRMAEACIAQQHEIDV